MTRAILCNGCEQWQTSSEFSAALTIFSNDEDEQSHLCEECAKLFWKWIDKIPKVEDD